MVTQPARDAECGVDRHAVLVAGHACPPFDHDRSPRYWTTRHSFPARTVPNRAIRWRTSVSERSARGRWKAQAADPVAASGDGGPGWSGRGNAGRRYRGGLNGSQVPSGWASRSAIA